MTLRLQDFRRTKLRDLLRPMLAAALLLFALAVPERARASVVVLDAGVSEAEDGTQLWFRLSDPAQYRISTLGRPNRLVIDLPPLDWLTPPAHLERVAARSAGVEAVRYGRFRPGTYRIVLDLTGPVAVTGASVERQSSAFKLAVSWRPATRFRPQSFGNYDDPPIPRIRPDAPGVPELPLIMIDPGHGGIDPGAIGKNGTREKQITLKTALMLKRLLSETGRYRVELTREGDEFLRLRDRIDMARAAKAELFLSLHADSAPTFAARGLSVYTLSDKASDKEAAALARSENRADLIGGLDLSVEDDAVVTILIDLAQRDTKNRSIRLANQLVQSLAPRVPVLSRAHRQAGFAVLKAPDIPAVLVELGFLSNPEEEKLLKSDRHLNEIAEGIVAAIDSFF